MVGLASAASAQEWTLEADPPVSNDGVYQLRWEGGEGAVALEEAPSAAFAEARVVYTGADRATVISGRSDGAYHYRLRSVDAGANAAVLAATRVEVVHHSLGTALAFFGVGLAVFLSTAVVVVVGSRASAADAGRSA